MVVRCAVRARRRAALARDGVLPGSTSRAARSTAGTARPVDRARRDGRVRGPDGGRRRPGRAGRPVRARSSSGRRSRAFPTGRHAANDGACDSGGRLWVGTMALDERPRRRRALPLRRHGLTSSSTASRSRTASAGRPTARHLLHRLADEARSTSSDYDGELGDAADVRRDRRLPGRAGSRRRGRRLGRALRRFARWRCDAGRPLDRVLEVPEPEPDRVLLRRRPALRHDAAPRRPRLRHRRRRRGRRRSRSGARRPRTPSRRARGSARRHRCVRQRPAASTRRAARRARRRRARRGATARRRRSRSVAVAHDGDRPAARRLGRDVADHQAAGRAGEAPVGDERDGVAEPGADDRRVTLSISRIPARPRGPRSGRRARRPSARARRARRPRTPPRCRTRAPGRDACSGSCPRP